MSEILPPIPPNSPYFTNSDEVCMPDETCDYPWALIIDDADQYQRGIIAAVARCAWLDEAAAWPEIKDAPHYASFAHLRDSGKKMCDPDFAEAYEALRGWAVNKRRAQEQAYQNARAWRMWGEALA